MSDINELIRMTPNSSRRCKYPSCDAEVLSDSPFEYCERCRSLAARNAVALRIDPCTPRDMERGNEMIFGVLTNLTGDEILNATRRIEEVYLQFQKFIKANNVESATRRAIKPTAEIIEEQRRRNEENAPIEKRMRAKADKGKKQRSTRMDKLQEMFPNMSREDIKKMMDEDIEL